MDLSHLFRRELKSVLQAFTCFCDTVLFSQGDLGLHMWLWDIRPGFLGRTWERLGVGMCTYNVGLVSLWSAESVANNSLS